MVHLVKYSTTQSFTLSRMYTWFYGGKTMFTLELKSTQKEGRPLAPSGWTSILESSCLVCHSSPWRRRPTACSGIWSTEPTGPPYPAPTWTQWSHMEWWQPENRRTFSIFYFRSLKQLMSWVHFVSMWAKGVSDGSFQVDSDFFCLFCLNSC